MTRSIRRSRNHYRRTISVGDMVVSEADHAALFSLPGVGTKNSWERVGYLYDGEIGLVVDKNVTEITILAPSCCGSRSMERFRRIRTTK